MTANPAQPIVLNDAESLYLAAAKNSDQLAPWLDTLRGEAADTFARAGLPHRRVETWKYTDLRALDKDGFTPAQPGTCVPAPLGLDVDEIIIRNGFVVEDTLGAERFDGIRLMSVRRALTEIPQVLEKAIGGARPLDRSGLYALNLSLMNDGLVLIAQPGAHHDRPIMLRYINDSDTPSSVHVRNVIVAGAGSRLTLIESREESASADFLNVVSDVSVAEGGDLKHYRMDRCNTDSLTVMLANADLQATARYENVGLSLGGKAARLETHVRFSGEGGYARLGGVLAGRGRDHMDHTTQVRHDAPACSCDEEFRAILSGRSRGVFQGMISVAPDAQKTDSRMLMRALLLSDQASLRGKPELEIYADDVKCAHGTSVGNLDEDVLFYMMSRGIKEEDARAVLVEAFCLDVIEAITDETVRSYFNELLNDRLVTVIGGAA